MKKYLFIAVAALAIASCSHDDAFDGSRNRVQDTYDAAFLKYVGGSIAGNQDWGFGTPASSRAMITRSITVNGDVYNKFPSKDEVNAKFPTGIPGDADELPTNGDYNYYVNNGAGHNYKITSAGTYTIGSSWQNVGYDAEYDSWSVPQPYNVYVSVEGNDEVVIKHNGSAMHNLYILKGNVKLDSSVGEMTKVVITVASGATLTDTRDHIAARTDLIGAVEIYNRGKFYATNSTKYDMGNKARFYNEGICNITGALTYSPADAENSFFMNLGDKAELTAPAMTLNSTGNFFNSGKVNITGNTYVTQANIVWVNAGHYTTGNMEFSAGNNTFYNYCHLFVLGNAHMYDGEFNMMPDSYTKAATAEFDNFFINMNGDAGIHVTGNVKLEAQGDGTFQGFKNPNNTSNNYLLIDGKVTVACHKNTFSIDPGITYSINNIEIVRGDDVVTEEYLQSVGDQCYPVLDLRGTKCPYGDLKVTSNDYSCGATWSSRGGDDIPETFDVRIIAEDLSASDDTDFDFNDVVFDVTFDENDDTKATVTLRAAGGTLPLTVDGHEVHQEFGNYDVKCMINTNADKILKGNSGYTYANNVEPVSFEVTGIKKSNRGKDIVIKVQKTDENGNLEWYTIEAEQGKPAAKIAVDTKFEWCEERESLKDKYPNFVNWVQNKDYVWY